MLVKELIELLKTMPQDSMVIMQGDEEGNSFSPLDYATSNALYKKYNDWSGAIFIPTWSHTEVGMDKKTWEKFKKETPPCVVLAPR